MCAAPSPFAGRITELGGGVSGRIDTLSIGDGLLGGLKIGGGNGRSAGAGCDEEYDQAGQGEAQASP